MRLIPDRVPVPPHIRPLGGERRKRQLVVVKVPEVVGKQRGENTSECIFVFSEETKQTAEECLTLGAPLNVALGLLEVESVHCVVDKGYAESTRSDGKVCMENNMKERVGGTSWPAGYRRDRYRGWCYSTGK